MFLKFAKKAKNARSATARMSSQVFRWCSEFLAENAYALCAKELFFVLIVSNAALIFLVFTQLVDTKSAEFSLSFAANVVRAAVSPAEVLVYLLAVVAPALWIMAHNWRARKHVGFYWLLLMVQAVLIVGSAYIYGRAKMGGIGNPEFVQDWAIGCLVTGICIWYTTLVYKRLVLDRAESRRAPSGKTILDDLNAAPASQGGEQ